MHNRLLAIVLTHLLTALGLMAQSGNQVVAAGYSIPEATPVSPGGVITLFVRGFKAADGWASTLPLPTTLNGVSVRVSQIIVDSVPGYPRFLPIFRIRSYDFFCGNFLPACGLTGITVQFPTESLCVPNPDCLATPIVTVTVEENGVSGQPFHFLPSFSPHILNSCDTIVWPGFGHCFPLIFHADGSLVRGKSAPGRPGEIIVLYGVGFLPIPPIKTGDPTPTPPPVNPSPFPVTISFRFNAPPAAPPPAPLWILSSQRQRPVFLGLVPGFVGLYQMNLRLPDTFPADIHRCQTEADVNIRLGFLFWLSEDPSAVPLCVEP